MGLKSISRLGKVWYKVTKAEMALFIINIYHVLRVSMNTSIYLEWMPSELGIRNYHGHNIVLATFCIMVSYFGVIG